MDHINVTSQLDRHKMLMDLAAAVKKHVDENPSQHDAHYEEGQNAPPVLPYQSVK